MVSLAHQHYGGVRGLSAVRPALRPDVPERGPHSCRARYGARPVGAQPRHRLHPNPPDPPPTHSATIESPRVPAAPPHDMGVLAQGVGWGWLTRSPIRIWTGRDHNCAVCLGCARPRRTPALLGGPRRWSDRNAPHGRGNAVPWTPNQRHLLKPRRGEGGLTGGLHHSCLVRLPRTPGVCIPPPLSLPSVHSARPYPGPLACQVFTSGGDGGVNRAPQNWGGGVREKGSINQSLCNLAPKAPKIFLSTKIGRFFFHQIFGK